ncbi:MAG: hypothetical protein AB7J35_16840 [Dehalococcoidia bacterium]
MDPGTIVISIHDDWLAGALTLWLAAALPGREVMRSMNGGVASATTVLFTPSDCPPERAAEFSARGQRVVILAPVARADEADRYLRAGADYVVMSVDNAKLLNVLQGQPARQ